MDLFILKTDVEKFTSTNEKTSHLIFKTEFPNKGQTKSRINGLLLKMRKCDTVDRCQAAAGTLCTLMSTLTLLNHCMVLNRKEKAR